MRNLKKFLALVLAMMMTLSLMVTVNAKDITADFTDADSVTEEFQEAVDVLNGMKVFQGYESGDKFEFQPKGDITRAEVATIVYRLATGDWEGNQAHLYKDYQKFDDVNSSQWFAGYINYCANAEWIAGYGNGKFGPNDKVTGYQAAAMILRAVGYGKNGEFAGTGWQVQVANVTRSKGLLDNVNKTNYANTLNNYATRELVAEILFQAAQIPTVTWTMLNGYNEYPVALPGPTTKPNDSLGKLNYGLAYVYGIVVDNQETSLSRKYTSLHEVDRNGDYHYSRTGVRSSHIIYRLGMETGLNEYGHAYKVWFDRSGTLNAAETESASTHTVYAAYDEVVKDELVWSTGANGNKINTGTAADNLLGGIADELDFAVPAYDAGGGTFQSSDAFGAFADETGGATSPSPSTLYRLISNSSSGSLDAVISLNVEATKITAVNHNVTGSNKTTSVAYTYGATENTAIKGAAATYSGSTQAAAGTMGRVNLLNGKLTGNSASTLSDFVVHNAIGAIDATATAHHLGKLTGTATGKVVSFYNPAGFDSLDPDYVILDDGKKIEKSALYNVVPHTDGTTASKDEAIIPQVWNTTVNDETYDNGTYEFILDADGKYVGARPVVSTDFIYGTYVDYTQETSSSTFNYFLTGIDQNGKQVTIPVTDARIPNPGTGTMDPIPGTSFLGVPYRDTATSVNGIGNGVYKAFVINGTKVSNHADDLKVFNGLRVAADADFENGTTNAALTIGKTDKTLGSVQTGTATNLYFTEKTKFVLVEGYGTENAKAEVYTGIGELMGDAKEVKIHLDNGFNAATQDMDHIAAATQMNAMTYLSTSPFIYAETVGVTANQVDVIYMPKAAVEFAGKSNLYYVGNNTPTLFNAYGNEATQFTMYDAEGNEVKMWIEGDSRATAANAAGATSAHIVANSYTGASGNAYDKFYELVPTEDKTIGGETIYKIGELNAAGNTYVAHADDLNTTTFYPEGGTITRANGGVGNYVATTKDSQVATINTDGTHAVPFNVGSAKVVNLSGKGNATTLGARYPGITDLSSLNDSASVNANLKVSVVVSDDNNMIVTTIFVAYNQNNA